MTTKEKQIELIKYIQTEIPEILDLKFGCEYEYVIADENGDAELQLGLWGYTGTLNKEEVERIIGRPITLSDVLRVIGKKEIDFDIYIDTNFLIYLAKKDTEKLFFPAKTKWEQEKDFNNQSEEFYNWLYELLIKNK